MRHTQKEVEIVGDLLGRKPPEGDERGLGGGMDKNQLRCIIYIEGMARRKHN